VRPFETVEIERLGSKTPALKQRSPSSAHTMALDGRATPLDPLNPPPSSTSRRRCARSRPS